eukprot:GHVH01003919.1.p1 GENE.GHVH01003919.1~~GHVH01003919.1.p1  ORF type:complete len:126 (+),score=16.41 GHVH01003919.1:47-424(+)
MTTMDLIFCPSASSHFYSVSSTVDRSTLVNSCHWRENHVGEALLSKDKQTNRWNLAQLTSEIPDRRDLKYHPVILLTDFWPLDSITAPHLDCYSFDQDDNSLSYDPYCQSAVDEYSSTADWQYGS